MKKKLIIVAILIMSVGFAIVSTNLIINGTSTIGKNTFDVYFSGAEVDGYDKTNEVVKSKKNIEFTSKDLLFTNDTSELIYEVTNNSSNYDAKVSVSCTNPSNKITVEEVPKSLTVNAKQIETGSIVVTLNEMAVDPEDVVITCTLNVNAEERTSLATDEIVVGTYGITGTLVDNNNNPIRDQYLAVYSETKHIVKTDINGFFYVGNLERGIHEIYLINENEIDTSDTEIKEKPKGVTSTNKNETIILSNNYKIKNTNIDTTTVMYQITLDTLDESLPNNLKYIRKGSTYGTLPTLEKEKYNFLGWYKSATQQDESTKVSSTDVYDLENNQTLYAGWDLKLKTLFSAGAQIGDYVAYDAGKWNETVSVPTTNNGTFGGYTANHSKNESVSCNGSASPYKGWRIYEINDDNVTLIHAGSPECFMIKYYRGGTYENANLMHARSAVYLNSNYASSSQALSRPWASPFSNPSKIIGVQYYIALWTSDSECVGNSYHNEVVTETGVQQSTYELGYHLPRTYRPLIKLKTCVKTPGKGRDYVGQDDTWLLDNSEC